MTTVETWPEDGFADWIGRTERARETIGPALVERFRATLFEAGPADEPGAPAPLGIHWCLAPPAMARDRLGPDGHPRKGLNLPPIPLPRRMWAGGELAFLDPLRVGDLVERTSTIEAITRKEGRTGRLAFLTIRHEIATGRGPAIRERQDIVYREPSPGRPASAPLPAAAVGPAGRVRPLTVDPVTLFRYSALTFNGHRIHYDEPYATREEGYAGLVVHGPLQATYLMHWAEAALGSLDSFAFRGVNPLIAGRAATIDAQDGAARTSLRVIDGSGSVTMTAEAARSRT